MKNLVLFILTVILFGCGGGIEKPNKPENLIPKDKMIDILFEVYLLNSAKGVNRKILEINGIYPESYVFEKYHIDSTQFANSNTYYTYDTKVYESILQSVKEKINAKKKEYEALEKVEEGAREHKADSLKKARAKAKDSLIKISKEKLSKLKAKN